MTYPNPHYFSAILDGIKHRFILILECECIQGNEDFSPPRFSVGAINATRDPRVSQFKQLTEVGVKSPNLKIPPGLCFHPFKIVQLILKSFVLSYRLFNGTPIHLRSEREHR